MRKHMQPSLFCTKSSVDLKKASDHPTKSGNLSDHHHRCGACSGMVVSCWCILHVQGGEDFWRTAWGGEGLRWRYFSPGKASIADWYSAKARGIGLLRTGAKTIFSFYSPLWLFGTSGKQLVWGRNGKYQHQACTMPTVKHSGDHWCVGGFLNY